ncbi:unnamed protein product [Bursaphelenchus okinawaensis]|uniref:Abnormal cell migration protein 18-like fibronectin type I domain-containing protein n=1 Tax=Bursaphelenchus okinawaensis TaxID=465554 RepID=A0A811LDY7_9BILA|nr:unnamed protein product [Bursaphelenchus okinawaensis]CAG9122084.1 unnamed protein product [Bursaphelenchus okinawaensis]
MKTAFVLLVASAFFAVSLAAMQCEDGDGKKYNNGQKWVVNNNFLKTCIVHDMGWETKIIACLNPQTKQQIPVGGSVTNGRFRIRCQQNESGGVSIKSEVVDA